MGNIWEVDEFPDDNEGLIMAEIELERESPKFELPVWVEREVTSEVYHQCGKNQNRKWLPK